MNARKENKELHDMSSDSDTYYDDASSVSNSSAYSNDLE